MPVKKGYIRKYVNLGTARRIRRLAAYREEQMRESGEPPTWTTACNKVGIRMQTVKRHALELAERWYDPNFHWQSHEQRKSFYY